MQYFITNGCWELISQLSKCLQLLSTRKSGPVYLAREAFKSSQILRMHRNHGIYTQKTWYIYPMLVQCWYSVAQHWTSIGNTTESNLCIIVWIAQRGSFWGARNASGKPALSEDARNVCPQTNRGRYGHVKPEGAREMLHVADTVYSHVSLVVISTTRCQSCSPDSHVFAHARCGHLSPSRQKKQKQLYFDVW